MKKTLSKPLVITGVVFQLIGIVWGLVVNWQSNTLESFFGQTNWPIFLGFVVMLIAVLQARPDRGEQAKQQLDPPKSTNQAQ